MLYKYSVPISMMYMDENSAKDYAKELKEIGAERIFLTCLEQPPFDFFEGYADAENIKFSVNYFKEQGFEVGIWMSGFGHGVQLSHAQKAGINIKNYQQIIGADGQTAGMTYCPLDTEYRKDYLDAIRHVASFKPDIIMLDDDFRLNCRGYTMGCCCPLHMKAFSEMVGENVRIEDMEQKVFSGGKNKYRTAWLKLSAKTLKDFAYDVRQTVDAVDENIRVGHCACCDTWDFSGVDSLELSKIFAGKTKPYVRTIAPPYNWQDVSPAVEFSRMQAFWCKNQGVELFTEGDVYPRPRYNVPAKFLEIFDLALMATGETDGILKYVYCYEQSIDYEKGYTLAHIKNQANRKGLQEIFAGKKAVGVQIFEAMHKLEDWVLPENAPKGVGKTMVHCSLSPCQRMFAQNAIPTCYDGGDVVAVFGENARHIPLELLKNGAILDMVAALILKERGVDTGVVSAKPTDANAELFVAQNEKIAVSGAFYQAECNPKAEITSVFLPDHTPASYLYENENNQRFFVLAYNAFGAADGSLTRFTHLDCCGRNAMNNYYNNYFRQALLIKAAEYIARKPLPIQCTNNPKLYSIVSKNNGEMAVALFNIFPDDIFEPIITLDKTYKNIRFVNCDGILEGNIVKLTRMEPYGFAAFEVK